MNTAILKAIALVVLAVVGGYFLLNFVHSTLGTTVPALQALYGGGIACSLLHLYAAFSQNSTSHPSF